MTKDCSTRTAVVILNWNKAQLTAECVNSLSTMEGRYDIYVVDNGSERSNREDLLEIIGRRASIVVQQRDIDEAPPPEGDQTSIVLVLLEKNYGYARGNNFALRLAQRLGYRYSLVSNNDIKVTERHVLAELIASLEKDPKAAWAAPRIVGIDDRDQGPYGSFSASDYLFYRGMFYPVYYPLYFCFLRRKEIAKALRLAEQFRDGGLEPAWMPGCFMLLKNNALVVADNFDESTFLYSEEEILAARLRKKDLHLSYVPSVSILHEHDPKERFDLRREYRVMKSKLYFLKTYRRMTSFQIFVAMISHAIWLVLYAPLIARLGRTSQ